MSYDDPNIQHKDTVRQILAAREKAYNAVSQARKLSLSTPHAHLAPTGGEGGAADAIACSQAVADYLLQLRPYRHQSDSWNVDFGDIGLPKRIQVEREARRRSESKTRPLWLCRQPKIALTGLSTLIDVLNMTVAYSSARPLQPGERDTGDSFKIETDEYGTLVVGNERLFKQVASGAATVDEIAAHPSVHPEDTRGVDEESYTPAEPPRADEGRMKTYKIVLPDDQLLRLVEAADDIAGEVDMLAEIDLPDRNAGGGDAV